MKDKTEQAKQITLRLKEIGIELHPKTQTLYKFTSIDTAKKILVNGMLRYQQPSNFNDPLDPHPGLLDMEDFRKSLNREEIFRHQPNLIWEAKKKIMNNSGILCLTTSHTNTLMWSHYAEKHMGVCFGFKNIGFQDYDGTDTFKVNYTERFESLPFLRPSSDEMEKTIALIKTFCTKSKVWEYEQEVRIIDFRKWCDRPINPGYICEIYFGVNTPEYEKSEILQLIQGKEYIKIEKIGQMCVSQKSFDLAIDNFFSLDID